MESFSICCVLCSTPHFPTSHIQLTLKHGVLIARDTPAFWLHESFEQIVCIFLWAALRCAACGTSCYNNHLQTLMHQQHRQSRSSLRWWQLLCGNGAYNLPVLLRTCCDVYGVSQSRFGPDDRVFRHGWMRTCFLWTPLPFIFPARVLLKWRLKVSYRWSGGSTLFIMPHSIVRREHLV